jgi:Methyltransferase domain
VFAGLEPTAGPVVDIGAGTGIGLAAAHAAAPGVRLVAIEPSPAMRAALHARLHDGRDLLGRTSVVPTRLAEAQLPDRAAAVLAIGVLGHLDDSERSKLWHYVATSLRPGAPAVIGLVAPARPVIIPGLRIGERHVGQHLVEGWSSAAPLDERSIAWTQRFRIADANVLTLREASATVAWRCDGVDDVRAEIAPHGLVLTEHDGCVVVRRREG